MSLRLWVSAVKLDVLKKWQGCRDKKLLKELLTGADQFLAEQDDEDITEDVKQFITDLINGRVNNDVPESGVEVVGTYLLVRHAATNPWPDESEEQEWSWAAIEEIAQSCGNRFKKHRDLLETILGGRTIFGTDFEPDQGWYTYLKQDEVVELKKEMQKVHDECAKIEASGALNEQDFNSRVIDEMAYMIDTFAVAEKTGDDLFIFAS